MKRFQLYSTKYNKELDLEFAIKCVYTWGGYYPKVQGFNYGSFVDYDRKVIGFVADFETAQRIRIAYGESSCQLN